MSDTAFFLASVISVGGTGLELRLDGEVDARIKQYKSLSSYVPTAGDRVLVIAISGTYLVVGNIADAPTTILLADQAKRLQTARNIALSGAVTGSVSFTGASNVTIPTSYNQAADRAIRAVNQYNSSTSYDIQFYAQYNNVLRYRLGTNSWYTLQNVT